MSCRSNDRIPVEKSGICTLQQRLRFRKTRRLCRGGCQAVHPEHIAVNRRGCRGVRLGTSRLLLWICNEVLMKSPKLAIGCTNSMHAEGGTCQLALGRGTFLLV